MELKVNGNEFIITGCSGSSKKNRMFNKLTNGRNVIEVLGLHCGTMVVDLPKDLAIEAINTLACGDIILIRKWINNLK